MNDKEMAKKIYDLRKQHNMTLEQVANLVGVGKSTVRKWETGQIENMRRDKIAKLSAALHTTPGYLMGWDEPESPAPIHTPEPPFNSPDEQLLLSKYRQLSPQGKDYIHQTMDIAVQVYKKHNPISNLEEEAG